MIRVVIDTVVFLRSLINPYSRNGKALFDRSGEYLLFVSAPIVQEILEVLQRPELSELFHTQQGRDYNIILRILGDAQAVDLAHVPPLKRDRKDTKFLQTAVAAKADLVVSEDRDLLDLKEYHGIRIVTVDQFLELLDKEKEHGFI